MMQLSKTISSGVLFALGLMVLTVLLGIYHGVFEITMTVGTLGIGSGPGIGPLQTDSAGLAILGIAIGAGLAIGLTGVGASIGMGTASAAALGAITEKPETFGKSILYVVFIEAIAIYGFVIAFLLMSYLPTLVGH